MAESKCILPPSPNWYCSSAADCSLTGAFAFVAKKRVYLLDVSRDPPSFKGQFSEHFDRTSAVAFCPHQGYANLCVSGSDDKTVKIWDVESKIITASHSVHQAKITCICWSHAASDLILSADEKGTIIAWRHSQNIVYSACPVQEYIFSVSASHQSEYYAAAGYKNGLIAVLYLDELGITVTHRLRGHDGDVHSIAWCPVTVDQLDLGPLQKKVIASQGNLIISGSRDQTIRLWNTLEGKLLSIFNLPKRSSQKWREKHDWQSKDRLWLAVCWPAPLPDKIISSSHGGELLLWDLSIASGPEQVKSFGQGHSRIVFNITCNKEGTKVMSCSMDRQIIIWDLQTFHSLHTIPTLGGFIYALDISPLDPGTLAIGVGDNMIRLWNTASSAGAYDSLTLWQGIRSKVQMVSWHPHKEGLLAFGTEDGQVGIYNTVSKKPEVFASYHKKTVYSVSWGPPCPAIKDKDESICHVYSCAGDGSVLEHRPGHAMQDPIDINALIKSTNQFKHKLMCRTDVAWNTSGTAMALGNDDGTIEVFTPPSLRRVCTISVHKKMITRLAWHHGYGDDSAEGEESYKFWLASGSNESTIHIHYLGSILRNNPDAPSSLSAPPITSSHRQLVGHSGRITALSWSPHHCNMIASGSYDGTAQVWDVEKSQPIANYRDHVGRIMSVKWSYLDPDVIYSGGEDGTVQPWRVSTQDHIQPPVTEKHSSRGGSKSSKSKKKSKSKSKANTMLKDDEKGEVLETIGISDDRQQKEEISTAVEQDSDKVHQRIQSDVVLDDSQASGGEWRRQADETPEVLPWRRPIESIDVMGTNQSDTGRSSLSNNLTVDQVNITLHDLVIAVDGGDDDDDDDASSQATQESGPKHVVSKTRSDAAKKKKKIKSMFPLSAVADNKSKASTQQECIALAQYVFYDKQGDTAGSLIHPEAIVPGESSHVNLGFFADRRSAYRTFATEGQHHSSASNLDYQLQLEVWKGNLGGALEMAIKARQLTDWLVALSNLAGHDVWLNTAESFADQLASQGIHQRAVLYYLACHKVYRAIDVYKKQSMYREAIGLAKVRLSPSDPVLTDLYCSWARKLETENSYEQAAKCYIAAKLPAEAARILSIRSDYSSLTTALQVSVISGEYQLAASLAVRVLHICLETGNWDDAHKVLALCTGVEGHVFALCVHELLVEELGREGHVQDDDFKDKSHSELFSAKLNQKNKALESLIDNIAERDPVASPWLLDTPTKGWFVGRVLKAWDRVGAFTTTRSILKGAMQQLSSYCQSNLNENLSMKQLLIRISYDISLGILHGIHQDNYSCTLPWLQALDACCKSSFLGFFLPQYLCVLLLPQGVQSLKDVTVVGREIIEANEEERNSNPSVEIWNEEIFTFFDAFYNLVLLYKIWWRDSASIGNFSASDSTIIDNQSSLRNTYSTIDDQFIGLPADSHDNSQVKAPIPVAEGDNDGKDISTEMRTKSDDFSGANDLPKEHFSSCTLSREFTSREITLNDPNETPDLFSVLTHICTALLRKDRVVCSALKKQLLEVKKEVILLRSRRILDSVAVAKTSTKKKRSSKKKESPKLGLKEAADDLDASTKEDVQEEERKLVTGNKENQNEALIEAVDGLELRNSVETAKTEDGKVEDGNKKGDVTGDQSFGGAEVLTTRFVPLDVRYKESVWSLERMQSEEQRLREELSKYPLQDFPFPEPVETALVIGHLCSHVTALPCNEPADLYHLGLQAIKSTLEHAQWNQELKCLKQLELRLTELTMKAKI